MRSVGPTGHPGTEGGMYGRVKTKEEDLIV